MAERRTSLWEDLWKSDGSRGLELDGVARAETGDGVADAAGGDKLVMVEASDGDDGRFSAWLTRASHRTAGSLSSITRTLPAFRGTASWNLQCNSGGKILPSKSTAYFKLFK
jgi:hypothetical protein